MEICLVTCDRKEYLERCIWSIIASTKYPYKIHVIDDVSTDGTIEVLDEFLNRGLIHTVIKNHTKLGTAQNFNKIIDQSSEDWFVMANDDMWFHKGWDVMVMKVRNYFEDCGAVSFYDFQRINNDDGVEKLTDDAWRVIRTGLGATYMSRESYKHTGKFQLPTGKVMGYFASNFCYKMIKCGVKRNRIYHLAEPLATHMDFPQCKLNERERYKTYGEMRRKQKNGK